MNIIDAAKLGMAEVINLARARRLSGPSLWLAVRGAATYYEAILTGDIASEEVQTRRADTCASCDLRRLRTPADIDEQAGYCGNPLNEPYAIGGTCGCLVTITVDGETRAAAKAVVRSQRCPSGKW